MVAAALGSALLEVIEEHDRFGVVLIDSTTLAYWPSTPAGWNSKPKSCPMCSKHATTGRIHIFSQGKMDRDHTKSVAVRSA